VNEHYYLCQATRPNGDLVWKGLVRAFSRVEAITQRRFDLRCLGVVGEFNMVILDSSEVPELQADKPHFVEARGA
jgi:hypothetical protein